MPVYVFGLRPVTAAVTSLSANKRPNWSPSAPVTVIVSPFLALMSPAGDVVHAGVAVAYVAVAVTSAPEPEAVRTYLVGLHQL